MKIITQLVILTLSLLLVNAHDDQYCSNLFKKFTNNCTASQVTIDNCCDLRSFPASGVYKMSKGSFGNSVNVYCDMITAGGGWIVIQRNKKNSLVNFNRNWTDYEKGFGDFKTEFWYGLQEMHCLTQRGQWEMRVDYQFTNKTWSYLHYNQFSVGNASAKYQLTVGGFTGISRRSEFAYHNKMYFSTLDNDNDQWKSGNCAISTKSGWWFNQCDDINLNKQPIEIDGEILFSEMKIRPKDCHIIQ